MGFIEDLRRQVEAREQSVIDTQRILREHRERAEREQVQQRLAEEQRHKERKDQAMRFDEESGLPDLISRFLSIVGNVSFERKGDSNPTGKGLFSLLPRDRDSVWRIISWNYRYGNNNYNWEDYFAVETCPDGTIYFHYGFFPGFKGIRENKWRTHKGILEDALDKAYHHPKKYAYYNPPSPSSHQSWDRGAG